MLTFLCTAGISGLALAAWLIHRNLGSRYPAFALYIDTSLAFWALVPAFAWITWNTPYRSAYAWFYFTYEMASDVLTIMVLREFYFIVYGRARSLPVWVPANVRLRIFGAIAFSLTITGMLYWTDGLGYPSALIRFELFAAVLNYLLFWCLALYARTIGLGLPGKAAGISTGFVLFMTINLFSLGFRGQMGEDTPTLARFAGSLAYIVSVAMWVWTARKKEETITISPQQWSKLCEDLGKC